MSTGAHSKSRDRLRDLARLLVAVISLYALALTPLLTKTSAALGASHPGVICQPSADGKDPAPAPAHDHSDACCVAAATPTLTDPPAAQAIALAWPREKASVPGWSDAAASPRETSPRRTARPRAPPTSESIG